MIRKFSKFILVALVASIIVACVNLRNRTPDWIGLTAQHVSLKIIHPQVLKQKRVNERAYNRVQSSYGGGILEVYTDYYLWLRKPLFTRWYTCNLDTNGTILDLESDWVWNGFL